jgi:hypothetical protein
MRNPTGLIAFADYFTVIGRENLINRESAFPDSASRAYPLPCR